MSTTTYKKLVVFDINLDWNCYKKEDRRYKDLPLVYDLIEQASKYQTIVIQTSGCLVDALDFLNTHNVKKGYLVASGGAIIYDIAAQKIIQCNTLDPDDIQTVVHHGIMHGVNVTIYTPDRKFLYVSNSVSYNSIKDMCYSQHEIIDNYELLQQTLSRTDIVDIGYYHFLGSVNNSKQNLLLYNLDKYWEDEICNIVVKINKTSSYVHVGDKQSTKLKAIEKLMGITGVENLSDVLYIAASCVNSECYITFKNSLITSNSDFINEIGNRKQHKYLAENAQNLDPEFGLNSNSFWK
ncbi:MAG: HAD hydrolase family protein [Mycoplasma sp.]|nr:HAD hydrolase family protein [Candidatus Hennigella equi]